MATRKPIPAEYQIHDSRFLELIVPGAQLRHLHDGGLWAEGPVYLPDSDTLRQAPGSSSETEMLLPGSAAMPD